MEEFTNKRYLDEGLYGKCYIIDEDKVLKIFKEVQPLSEIEKFKYLKKYSNESFLFPFEFVYDNKGFHGYITKKALGNKLKTVLKRLPLSNLSICFNKLERDVEYISEGKILIHDLHDENIMYNENKLEVIDPDFYEISGFSSKEVKDINSQKLRYLITNIFLNPYLKNKIDDMYVLEKLKGYRYSKDNVSEIILKLKRDFENYYNEEINNIEDLDNIIKR